nr:hypothetical protein BaRGS_021441 [Batillaria attramentaria]
MELERRGYLKSGVFTPEVVLDHPERVTSLHEELVHAGSDIVEAFTEQVEWAVRGGADMIIAETFNDLGEAKLALEAILKYGNGNPVYPLDLACVQCSRGEIRDFAREIRNLGVQYVGLCCGNTSSLLREIAQVYGRNPPSSRYAPDLSQNFAIGELYKRSSHILTYMMGGGKKAGSNGSN